MTNKEYLIAALNGEMDDDGAALEAVLNYNIECPYNIGDERALCASRTRKICRETCVECKGKWLDMDIDG